MCSVFMYQGCYEMFYFLRLRLGVCLVVWMCTVIKKCPGAVGDLYAHVVYFKPFMKLVVLCDDGTVLHGDIFKFNQITLVSSPTVGVKNCQRQICFVLI